MSDMNDMQMIQTRFEQHQEAINAAKTEIAVLIQRTNALETRTDRMMTDSAENRAETRKALSDILVEIRSLREFKAVQQAVQPVQQKNADNLTQADKDYQKRVRLAKQYAVPVIISLIALAHTFGWLDF